MPRDVKLLCGMVLVAGFILSCAGRDSSKEPWVYSPITEMTQVAGMWEGLLAKVPSSSRQEDWVKLMIRPDGAYAFESYRTIGVFRGRGQFSLKDGKLAATSERGTISGSLYRSSGSQMLKAEGMANDGIHYRAELTPKK
jgi:hypothetical protein